jgi:feruloyl-CoA synthase
MQQTLAPIDLVSRTPLGPFPARVMDDLVHWASEAPNRTFLAQRDGTDWRTLTYADALAHVRAMGGGLLARGASVERPVAVIAENGIDHALVACAAMYAGVPVAPLSVVYARPDADPERLRALLDVLTPAVVFTAGDAIAELHGNSDLADDAFASVTASTPAKILFTSGSTGVPKGVITTNRMLAANYAMYAQAWPQSAASPTLVDWLPWSHCFGGSFVFGVALHNGGTLYIDEGKPAPGAFDATIRNLREIAPTSYYNVPRGFALLLDALEADAALATTFFSRLHLLCNAGAALPSTLRERLTLLMERYAVHDVAIISCWGATETAPLATGSWENPAPDLDTIGTPVPGVEIRLAPVEDRHELRVRGPNVTPGYWRNPVATAAAFDEEGFYKTGDAGALRDPANPAAGIDFCGRIAENFKLSSGTWVNVGNVRIGLLEATPVLEDAVIAGHDGDEIVALFFLALSVARALAADATADHTALSQSPAVRDHIFNAIRSHNASHPHSSMRIARAILLPEPPNRAEGEITDKGSINQGRALMLRAAAITRLTANPDHPEIMHFA